MSKEIKELVKRLRDSAITLNRPGGILNPSDWLHAADALEAQAGEVERLKDACKYDALNAGAIAEIRRACKEIMGGNVTFVDDDFARCLFTLSAERDRLKAALEWYADRRNWNRVKWEDNGHEFESVPVWDDEGYVARKALGEAP